MVAVAWAKAHGGPPPLTLLLLLLLPLLPALILKRMPPSLPAPPPLLLLLLLPVAAPQLQCPLPPPLLALLLPPSGTPLTMAVAVATGAAVPSASSSAAVHMNPVAAHSFRVCTASLASSFPALLCITSRIFPVAFVLPQLHSAATAIITLLLLHVQSEGRAEVSLRGGGGGGGAGGSKGGGGGGCGGDPVPGPQETLSCYRRRQRKFFIG